MKKKTYKPRYTVMGTASSGGVDYWEYRYVHTRSHKGVSYDYWMPFLKGTTWVKLSKKQGDWGWCPKERRVFMHRARTGELPYHASKKSALREAIKETKEYIRDYGDEWGDPLLDEEATPSEQLATYERAMKRMK